MSAKIVTMPKLSDTMEEGGIYEWLYQEGEHVEEGEALLEIETDKATMEYSAPEEGYLRKILQPKGAQVPLMAPIAVLTDAQDEAFDLEALLAAQQAPAEQPAASATVAAAVPPEATTTPAQLPAGRVKASPLAKKLAADHGVSLQQLSGSGPHGRIVKVDVEDYIASSKDKNTVGVAGAQGVAAGGATDLPQATRRVELSMMRKAIAQSLSASKQQIPHYYLRSTWNMDALVAYRQQWNQHLAQQASCDAAEAVAKISLNDCFIFAVARALRHHPMVRSFWGGDHLIENAAIHVAMAVAIPDGLVTPTIHHADQLSLTAIARRARQLIAFSHGGAKERSQLDLKGGVITISNLGSSRVDEFSAVINPPQAAILAIGQLRQAIVPSSRAAEVGGITTSAQITATLSCDHRVIDGKVGADFLDTLAQYIENPTLMML